MAAGTSEATATVLEAAASSWSIGKQVCTGHCFVTASYSVVVCVIAATVHCRWLRKALFVIPGVVSPSLYCSAAALVLECVTDLVVLLISWQLRVSYLRSQRNTVSM
jgi:phosphotransferase system  glucose/maltose/N-acetylglucosamine-specific IIC component